MKIIVLSATNYKEKDGVVQTLTPNGVVSFTVKGLYDAKSKNGPLTNQMTIAEIDSLDGRYRYPLIKSSTIIHSPIKTDATLEYYAALSVLEETTIKLMQDEEKGMMFKHLEAAVVALKNSKDPWMILLVYIANVLKATGYECQVTCCVRCGERKDIRIFSFKEGGFVCGKCLREGMTDDLTNDQKMLLRSAFLSPDYVHISDYLTKENAIALLLKFRDFIFDSYGVLIQSINNLIEYSKK